MGGVACTTCVTAYEAASYLKSPAVLNRRKNSRSDRENCIPSSRLTERGVDLEANQRVNTRSRRKQHLFYFFLSMMRDSVFNCCISPPYPPGGSEEHHQHSSRAQAPPPNDRRFLIFFDFDETLVDECSDDSMVTVAPGGVLPNWLKDTYRPGRYNEYMQRVLAYLAEQGVTPAAIRSTVEKLPPCPGIPTLMRFLLSQPSHDFEVICVSDANTVFIETWLQHQGFRPLFLRIFTNPAQFDDNGQLQLRPFHSHDCLRCPANMCKAVVVKRYLAQRIRERGGRPYQKVLYVGDGANDFCPSLTLSPSDIAFPRWDFPMHKLIREMGEAKPGEFKASVVPWKSGEDVISTLKKILERP